MTGAAIPLVTLVYVVAAAMILLGVRDRDWIQTGCGGFLLTCLTWAVAQ